MRTVYKYELIIDDYIEISTHRGAETLTVQMQENTICLWMLVDPSLPEEKRTFRMAGTGHPISESRLKYVGTFQLLNGKLIFHLFELFKREVTNAL